MDTVLPIEETNVDNSTWHFIFEEIADPRTSHLFLMSNPIPVVVIVTLYLFFVLKWGPNYMKHRKPFELKRPIMIYNLIQVAWNGYLFYHAFRIWVFQYNWNCQPVDKSNSPMALLIVSLCYSYFWNKISDFLDTIFFVLRKKDRQISFLHVFHHSIMPLMSWALVKYLPGGHGTFIGLLNTFVHIVLYSYYFLAAFGPKIQKYLWWKKYITRMQLIQFCLVFIHQIQLVFFDCGFPKYSLFISLPNAIFFYYLFNDFYRKSYTTKEEDAKKKVKSN